MNRATHKGSPRSEAHVRAEGAAWLARLHGPWRSHAVEVAFHHWLAESPAHMRHFELLSDLWELAGALQPRVRRGHSTIGAQLERIRRAILG